MTLSSKTAVKNYLEFVFNNCIVETRYIKVKEFIRKLRYKVDTVLSYIKKWRRLCYFLIPLVWTFAMVS